MTDVRAKTDPDWWRGAVIYQIYPRSCQDSDGDGIGDLAGITRRLPYVASLGVDAIWISPFFTSPMKDFGYDVADYRGIDPMFGSLDDFDGLLAKAHGLGLKIIIDLVLSHTSDQHPWFCESRANCDSEKADWYVWAAPKPDGTPPNNWLSIFGGPAWSWDSRRCQYYLHNFLKEQPDLNFHNPKVREALLDVARFWLERGVDGFRLDTVNFYVHDKLLRDNPPLEAAARSEIIAPKVNPYNYQQHIYDRNRPETLGFLRRLRALLDDYEARTTIGEVGDGHSGLEMIETYTAGGELLHMCYDFQMLAKQPLTAERISSIFSRPGGGLYDGGVCLGYSNHDVPRHTSRWQLSPEQQRLYLLLLLCLRGSALIYQGEELGLPEADVAFEDLRDPYGIAFWPEYKGRDGCRTPMIWQADAPNGGFSTGTPWLPVSPAHLPLAAESQENDEHSMLHGYRRLIAFFKQQPALIEGEMALMRAVGDLLRFKRLLGGEELLCLFNLGEEALSTELPQGDWRPLDLPVASGSPSGQHLKLPAWSAAILRQGETR